MTQEQPTDEILGFFRFLHTIITFVPKQNVNYLKIKSAKQSRDLNILELYKLFVENG